AGLLATDETPGVYRGNGGVSALPGDGAAGERIAGAVLRGRGELHGRADQHAGRGRGDGNRADRDIGDGDRRGAVLPFCRGCHGDGAACLLPSDETVGVYGGNGGVSALPGDGTTGERIAGTVLRGGG